MPSHWPLGCGWLYLYQGAQASIWAIGWLYLYQAIAAKAARPWLNCTLCKLRAEVPVVSWFRYWLVCARSVLKQQELLSRPRPRPGKLISQMQQLLLQGVLIILIRITVGNNLSQSSLRNCKRESSKLKFLVKSYTDSYKINRQT